MFSHRLAVTFVLLLIGLMLINAVGCAPTSQERIEQAKQFVVRTQEVSSEIDRTIDQAHQVISKLESQREDAIVGDNPNLVEWFTGQLVKAKAWLNQLVTKKAAIDQFLQSAEIRYARVVKLGEIGFGNELVAIGETVNDVAPLLPPQLQLPVGIFTTVIMGIGGMLIKRKIKKNQDNVRAVENIVRSVDALMVTMPEDEAIVAKDKLKSAQSFNARDLVRKIKETT